jgi:hypothetical protein
MAKIDITRTELVWPGKYDETGQISEFDRVNLPFQVIEVASPGIFLVQPNSFPYLFPAFPFPFESRFSFVDFY